MTDDAGKAANVFSNVFIDSRNSVALWVTKRERHQSSIKLSCEAVDARKLKTKLYNQSFQLRNGVGKFRKQSKLSDSLISNDKKISKVSTESKI